LADRVKMCLHSPALLSLFTTWTASVLRHMSVKCQIRNVVVAALGALQFEMHNSGCFKNIPVLIVPPGGNEVECKVGVC